MPQMDLVDILTGYVRPCLEYSAPVWHCSLSQALSEQFYHIQKRACHIILGTAYVRCTDALKTLSLQTLEEQREELCLDFATSLDKSHFRDGLNACRREVTGRTLSTHRLTVPHDRAERYKRSPIPYSYQVINKTLSLLI